MLKINHEYVTARRAESAAILERGEPLPVRTSWPVHHFGIDPYLVLEVVEGRLRVRLRVRQQFFDFFRCPMVRMDQIKNFLFLDQEALELALPLLPAGLRLFIAAEAEQGIPGLSLVLARDLEQMFWAPVENPTVGQWKEWLGCTTEELIDLAYPTILSETNPFSVNSNDSHMVYEEGLIRSLVENDAWNSNGCLVSWLPQIRMLAAEYAINNTKMLESLINEGRVLNTAGKDCVSLPDGPVFLLHWNGHYSLRWLHTACEGRILKPAWQGLALPTSVTIQNLFGEREGYSFCGKGVRRRAPLDLLVDVDRPDRG